MLLDSPLRHPTRPPVKGKWERQRKDAEELGNLSLFTG
jgi:hypothetical protein